MSGWAVFFIYITSASLAPDRWKKRNFRKVEKHHYRTLFKTCKPNNLIVVCSAVQLSPQMTEFLLFLVSFGGFLICFLGGEKVKMKRTFLSLIT